MDTDLVIDADHYYGIRADFGKTWEGRPIRTSFPNIRREIVNKTAIVTRIEDHFMILN